MATRTLQDLQDEVQAAETTFQRAQAELAHAEGTENTRVQELSELATRLHGLKSSDTSSSEFLEVQAMHRMASAGIKAIEQVVAKSREEVSAAGIRVSQAHSELNNWYNHNDVSPAERSRRQRHERKMRDERKKIEREQEEKRRFEEWQQNIRGEKNCYEGGLGPLMPLEPAVSSLGLEPYQAWKLKTDMAFKDYAAIEEFPAPPAAATCGNTGCVTTKATRMLKACPCNIRTAFEALNLDPKDERLKWHPDKFSRCKQDRRDEFQEKAKEVFQVVERMHAEAKK